MIPNEIETEIKALIEASLVRQAASLKEAGLEPGEVLLDLSNGSDDKRESEIQIYFYMHGNLVDALEFHIYRNGKLVVTTDQVIAWFIASVADVITKSGAVAAPFADDVRRR